MQERTCGLDRGESGRGGAETRKDRTETKQARGGGEGEECDEKSEKRRWKDKQRGTKLEILSGVKELVKLLTHSRPELLPAELTACSFRLLAGNYNCESTNKGSSVFSLHTVHIYNEGKI